MCLLRCAEASERCHRGRCRWQTTEVLMDLTHPMIAVLFVCLFGGFLLFLFGKKVYLQRKVSDDDLDEVRR